MTLDMRAAGCLLLALASMVTAVEAAPVAVVTGNLATDDDVFTTTIHIDTAGAYRFESWSYAGGTMSDGTVVPAGGFDVILSVFDAVGQLLQWNDDGGLDRIDPASSVGFDAFLSLVLDPGDYTLAVTQYDSEPIGPMLSDGFTRQGEGNFTPGLVEDNLCTATSFCDVSQTAASARTSFFAVDVTPVPLPPALALLGTGLVGLGLRSRAST